MPKSYEAAETENPSPACGRGWVSFANPGEGLSCLNPRRDDNRIIGAHDNEVAALRDFDFGAGF